MYSHRLRYTITMITTFTGSNSYALHQALQERVATFLVTETDMGLERLDADESSTERLSEALTSLPFLTTKKLIIIRGGANNKPFTERAEPLLKNLPDTSDVILVEPKLDKRSSYYKLLKKTTEYQEFLELDQHGLARWLTGAAVEQGGSLSQSDANYLVQRVGVQQQLLANELDKLLLHAAHIDRPAIDALTDALPQSTIFELIEAAFSGNPAHALRLYEEQRALKVEPQQIIAMLSWQLHVLALVKAAGKRAPEAIASQAKISPYTVKKSLSVTRNLPMKRLKEQISALMALDAKSKRQTYNIDDAIKHYILTL